MKFSKEFSGWSLRHNDHLMLTYIETRGNDLEEMIENTMITLETWFGEEGPDWTMDDLPNSDYAEIVKLFIKHLENV